MKRVISLGFAAVLVLLLGGLMIHNYHPHPAPDWYPTGIVR